MIETSAHYTKMKDFPLTGEVTLNEYELYNLIDYIEIWFINILRQDTDIDNCEYVMTIMTALQKMKRAYAAFCGAQRQLVRWPTAVGRR